MIALLCLLAYFIIPIFLGKLIVKRKWHSKLTGDEFVGLMFLWPLILFVVIFEELKKWINK